MSAKLKHSIVKHLTNKGSYEPEVDDYLIDMIIQNMAYAEEARKNLDKNGIVVATTSGNGFTTRKMNPAFGILQMCERQIHQAANKLGINRKDRLMLKLVQKKEESEFHDLMNS